MEWQPIETAPKDGTVLLVKNRVMDRAVEARWGEYHSRAVPKTTMQWVLVRDPDRFMPLPPGTLVIPDVWSPLPAPPSP